MKRSEYKEKSVTAQGRKNLHEELISEIKQRMDSFVDNAPAANKAKVRALFDKALCKISEIYSFQYFDQLQSVLFQLTDKHL